MQKTENPQKNQAQHVDPEIERQLWEHGKLDDDEPFMLIYTLQLMCGKYLGIRGGDELRSVRCSCLAFGFDQKTGITTLIQSHTSDTYRHVSMVDFPKEAVLKLHSTKKMLARDSPSPRYSKNLPRSFQKMPICRTQCGFVPDLISEKTATEIGTTFKLWVRTVCLRL